MTVPNPSDLHLLQLIDNLTRQHQGRPPSLSDVAVAAGLQGSARGTIHRQLSRLKPKYVIWNASPRSLAVTPLGRSLLIGAGETSTLLPPAPDTAFMLLASGLTHLLSSLREGKPLQAPYPTPWQRGMNLLAAECIQRGLTPPGDTVQAVELCQQPISAWPLSFAGPPALFDRPLLEGDEPTELCHELALNIARGDAEYEICEQSMRRVRGEAAIGRSQESYVAFRRQLIETPVVSQEDLLAVSFRPDMEAFGGELNDLYEPVPRHCVQEDRLLLCGHCGWTLERWNGRLRCGDDRCRKLTANFTRGTTVAPVVPDVPWVRVRRPIRRYVTAPGVYELSLLQQLQSLGVSVELWPGFDSYDLRLTFPNEQVWAVDVKDWRHAYLLARRLEPLSNEGALRWDQAFYAVPDDRVSESTGYLTTLQSAATDHEFSVIAISDLVEAAQRESAS